LTTLKQDLDNLTTSSAAANDGSKKDIAQRDKDRQVVEQDLDLLSAWVLKIANGDPAIITSSGFMLASPRAKSSPEPLPQPVVDSVTQGVSRQLLAEISAVRKARLRSAYCGADKRGYRHLDRSHRDLHKGRGRVQRPDAGYHLCIPG
jgi:hypothetical protein